MHGGPIRVDPVPHPDSGQAGTGVRGCLAADASRTKRLTLIALLAPLLAALPVWKLSPGEVRVSSRPWQPTHVLRRTTRQVEIGVVVRNKKGMIVPDLKRQDFAIYDDGKKQEISHFTVVARTPLRTPQPAIEKSAAEAQYPAAKNPAPAVKAEGSPQPVRPRDVALYFDDFHMPPGDVRHVQVAAENFMRTELSGGERVGLFTASGSPQVNFTPNASRVLSALPDLRSHLREFGGGACPRMTPHDAYLIANNLDPTAFDTALWEAIACYCEGSGNDEGCHKMEALSVREKARAIWEPTLELSLDTLSSLQSVVSELAQMPGDRVLVLASSGFYTDCLQEPVSAILDEALQSGIVINAIDARGLFTTVPAHWHAQTYTPSTSRAEVLSALRRAETFDSNVLMSRLAMIDFVLGTGGRFFRDRNDITAGYYQLAAAPRTEYLLSFAPEKLNGKYHKLQVHITIPGDFDVQTRPGYFATKPGTDEALSAQSRLDAAVLSDSKTSEFPATTSYQVRQVSSGKLELRVAFHVDLKKLPVLHRDGRSVEQIAFVAALFGPKGHFVVGKRGKWISP
jgi:VWFA-related protein